MEQGVPICQNARVGGPRAFLETGKRSVVFALAAVLANGCVQFHPTSLEPAQTAAALEGRDLTNPGLREFISTNLHRKLTNSPATTWDFEMLALAAFYYHPSLEVARADWRAAMGGERTAAERPNPTVTESVVYEPAANVFSPWIPGLMFDLPVETAGKRGLRARQAAELSESARLNLAAAAWQVRSRLRACLVEFIAARQRAALLTEQFELREDYAKRLRSQYEAGAISGLELNAAGVALARSHADLAEALRLSSEARPRLANAIGLPTAALEGVDLTFDLRAIPGAEELTKNEARDLALRGRADILAALADYAATQSALQLEVAKQYPDIHLAPGYSWNAGSTGEHDWQIGATVELPLLNRHRGAIAEASARRDASAARFIALQSSVIGQVEAAVASFRASQTNLTAWDALATSQTEQGRRVRSQFEAGEADRLDVLGAAIEDNATRLARSEAVVKMQQSVGSLEDAVQRPFNLPGGIFDLSKRRSVTTLTRREP